MKHSRPMIRRLTVIACMAFGLPLVTIAAPGDRPCPPLPGPVMDMPPPGSMLPPQFNALNLNAAQQDKLFEIIYRQMPAMHRAMMRAAADRKTLNALAHAATYDEKAAQQAAADLGKTEATAALLQNRQQQQIYTLLDSAQRKRLQQLENEHAYCGHPAHHDGGNHGMPPANSCRNDAPNDRMSNLQPLSRHNASRLRT